ncbi:MAG: sulfatase-like hydrolase/transferase [Candidatus Omnitrophota bacterium]
MILKNDTSKSVFWSAVSTLTATITRSFRAMIITLILSMFSPWGTEYSTAKDDDKKPINILFILTDNQPPSTIGCYGNKEIYTPNIDRLAAEGIQFQNAFACNGMCSPTRASIMTALMPSQHGVHTQLSDQLQKEWPKNWCSVSEFRTLPQTLSDAGYQTALIGKYHLGIPDKPHLKFDDWVTFPDGHTWCFYGNEIIDNGRTYRHEGHLTDFWTKKAVEYIESYDGKKPFFIYLAYDAPYSLPPSISGPAKNRFAGMYEGKEMKYSPQMAMNKMMMEYMLKSEEYYGSAHANWIKTLNDTLNDQDSIRNLASQVTLVDDGVGKVLEALKKKGLDENTLVVFTSDQGIAYGQKGFWGQTENSIPSNLYETPMSVPLIFRHKDHIPTGQKTDMLVNDYDLFPTILGYAGLGYVKIANTPGKDITPLLKGGKTAWDRDAIFMEQEVTRAIRTDEWKYIKRCPVVVEKLFSKEEELSKDALLALGKYPNFEMVIGMFAPPSYGDELYNIKRDPGETENLASDPKYAKVKDELGKRLTDFFDKYSDPKYDLWKGGTVKSNSNVEYIWKKIWPGWKPLTDPVERPFSDKK